jgi:hypothetical protein
VTAGPIVPPGHYCLSYDEGGTDFTSNAQCLETASGIVAECYGRTARDDEASRRARPAASVGTDGYALAIELRLASVSHRERRISRVFYPERLAPLCERLTRA